MTEIFFKCRCEFPLISLEGDARLSRCNLHILKENIADGSYIVSAAKVAEKILSAQLFLFTHYC